MDIPPELRDAATKEGPAAVGGMIGALLVASGFLSRVAYFVCGYLLARYVGRAVDNITGVGMDVGALLAGVFGLLAIESCVAFLRGIGVKEIAAEATNRIRRAIRRSFGGGPR